MARDDVETTDVLICGGGPTGALLSALLGQLGVKNICLDREANIVTDPRGIALDEDGIRALQSIGILDTVYTEIGRCMGIFNFVGGVHSNLTTKPFMRLDYGTSEGGTGHVGFICHKQPVMEKHIRRKIAEHQCSQLRTSCTLTSIDEDQDWVFATYVDNDKQTKHQVRAKFLVGADGKTGFTRKMYLEPKGVLMQQISEIGTYAETWVAMNLKMSLPTPQTHPDFPLWQKGLTPEQVFNLFFPDEFRFLCNPDRPAVCGHFGQPEDRLWRFEYVVQDGEDGTEMAERENVKRIVFPYLTHPGWHYGLDKDVAYPEDCIEILRARQFFFAARSCNVWARDRVLLCGDAAHVFPPYGGQGIASGFRDAVSLAWRLKVACQQLPNDYDPLFRAWYLERKQQLEQSLAATVDNGRRVTERNPLKIFFRDSYLWAIQMIPSWKRWIEQGPRREGICRYSYGPGLHFLEEFGGGLLLPQVYCTSLHPQAKDVMFTDDIIHAHRRQGLFQLVSVLQCPNEIDQVLQEIRSIDIGGLSNGFMNPVEAIVIVHDLTADLSKSQAGSLSGEQRQIVRVASASEFAASRLCEGRPEPRHYDPFRIQKELPGTRFVIVRPDNFVFAACANTSELRRSLQLIEPTLKGDITRSAGRKRLMAV